MHTQPKQIFNFNHKSVAYKTADHVTMIRLTPSPAHWKAKNKNSSSCQFCWLVLGVYVCKWLMGCVWVAGWSMFVFAACERVWFAASPAAELQFVSVVSQSAICGLSWFLHIIAMATHNRLSQLLGFWAPGRHPSLCPTFAAANQCLHRSCLSLFLPFTVVMGI